MYFLCGLVISKHMYLNFGVLNGKNFRTLRFCDVKAKARELILLYYYVRGGSWKLIVWNKILSYIILINFRVSQTFNVVDCCAQKGE